MIRADGNRKFCTRDHQCLRSCDTTIYCVWANKVHCIGFCAIDSRPAIFSRSPSGYMGGGLGLDYIMKHFDVHTTPAIPPNSPAETPLPW